MKLISHAHINYDQCGCIGPDGKWILDELKKLLPVNMKLAPPEPPKDLKSPVIFEYQCNEFIPWRIVKDAPAK